MSDLMITRFTPVRQSAVRTVLDRPIRRLRIAMRTYLTRRALPELGSRELADIGISSDAAIAEAARLPWDVTPGPRRRNVGRLIDRVHNTLERARTRRLIARLWVREMHDIGISPSEAQAEASKRFWQA